MQKIGASVTLILLWFFLPPIAFAATSNEVTTFTSDTLNIITLVASAAAVFFLIRGGYSYITSTGKPEALDEAKKTIKNALLGLVLVLAASSIVSLFRGALVGSGESTSSTALTMSQIESVAPSEGLAQVLIDAVNSFIQNIVESATKPIISGIVGFLVMTPGLLNNSTILNFWLVSLGIVDSLFVIVVALLGLQLMSASTFGFEEIELKQLLPRIGLAFLGANISLFLADYVIKACNALVSGILSSTGGLNHAWIENAVTLQNIATGTTPIITLIFLLLFLILAIVLLLMYISRLIIISLGAVLSPFVFLLWTLPKTADFAELAVKGYFVSVFMIFIHVVTIQLAASFLTLPENNANSLISIAVAIGLFLTLLKTPAFMMQLIFFTSQANAVRRLGGQVINVMSTDKTKTTSKAAAEQAVKTPRRTVNL